MGSIETKYYDLSWNKFLFIITPPELEAVFTGYHFVVQNTGVPKGYIESDPRQFFETYEALYQKLKNGEKLIWKKDYAIADFHTGITRHIENCIYAPSSKQSIPVFREPCPLIETFCFLPWKEQLSTSFSITQTPENICGLRMVFPSKIEYTSADGKHEKGIVEDSALDDYETFCTIIADIKNITKPLKLLMNNKSHRTAVRISPEAKRDLAGFYFITANNITII